MPNRTGNIFSVCLTFWRTLKFINVDDLLMHAARQNSRWQKNIKLMYMAHLKNLD